ncbi:hypothetical protein A6769_32905 [Nostoc punctiforme NIES-2108]|uniref:Transposase IS4-like domain-containing protein n=1 Tax=Nostoc punctiforme NIES-2108 TaxID=1356359 RepID=A0A367R2G0_NOSPU|nr:hypothetical protein A6769_32905 [Nostoc punctiforme NIES-2108]
MNFCRWIVQVVLRSEEAKGFVLLEKRWVVEQTFSLFTVCGKGHFEGFQTLIFLLTIIISLELLMIILWKKPRFFGA